MASLGKLCKLYTVVLRTVESFVTGHFLNVSVW